jgi:hypothetical protein
MSTFLGRWRGLALAVLMTIAVVGALGEGSARAQSSVAEGRARAIVEAFSSGQPQALEQAARANYSAAALARRTPEQRAATLQQIFSGLGALQIVNITTTGDSVTVSAHGARGGDGVFTFTLGAAPERRIESLGIQTTGVQATAAQRTDNPYAPYVFLIGDWDTQTPGTAMEGSIHQTFRWGPSNSYIQYTIHNSTRGQTTEQLHQDGMMIFNAATHTLEFLFVHEPGSFGLEKGTLHAEPDGSLVRETTAVEGDGTINHFRQTFRRTGANTAVTTLMRQNADGTWAPNFAGADNLVMTRRTT